MTGNRFGHVTTPLSSYAEPVLKQSFEKFEKNNEISK